jgi:RHS repeat-associated protein
LTNDSGAWVEKYAYTLYGKPAAQSTIGNPYMYTGRRLDAETGLYYYRARYYDPHLRRFIQTDPIGYAGGMNLYAYVRNSSVNLVDPYGLYSLDDFFSEIADVSAGFGDTLSGGDTARIRQMWYDAFDWEDPINECSFSYKAGIVYAFGWDVVFSAATMNSGGAAIAARSSSVLKTATSITKNSGIHKNSLNYTGETHVYRIKGPEGTYKIGQSAQGTRIRDGASIRAEQQVRKLNREIGPGHSSEIRKSFPNKAAARGYETKLIERFRRILGQDSLPGNKSNR